MNQSLDTPSSFLLAVVAAVICQIGTTTITIVIIFVPTTSTNASGTTRFRLAVLNDTVVRTHEGKQEIINGEWGKNVNGDSAEGIYLTRK